MVCTPPFSKPKLDHSYSYFTCLSESFGLKPHKIHPSPKPEKKSLWLKSSKANYGNDSRNTSLQRLCLQNLLYSVFNILKFPNPQIIISFITELSCEPRFYHKSKNKIRKHYMHIRMWSSNLEPNSQATSTSNTIKQKLCLLPKNISIVWLSLQKEVRLNRDSVKKRRQKNHTEAEKLDSSSQLTFLKVPSNSAIFPDSKCSKNKKHKGYKQCGYWSLTKNYHEHWTCRGLSEMCQPFKIQSCTWGTERGLSISCREIQPHQLCICQAVLNSRKTQMRLHRCHKATYPVHWFYPNYATTPIL